MKRSAVWLLLLLTVPALGLARERLEVDKRAKAALVKADKLVYRPLDEGLKDISFEFEVQTKEGRLRCLWLYRAATKELGARQRPTVKNRNDRRVRRRLTAGLKEWFDLVTYPILLTSFADEAEGMNVTWSDKRGGQTVLEAPEDGEARFNRIAFVWNEDLLPREISWSRMEEDPEEGPYRIELTATYQWKKSGRDWVLAMINTDRTGTRVLAKYQYARAGGILLPSKVTRINPFSGEDEMTLTNLRVNQGISDEEFAKWR